MCALASLTEKDVSGEQWRADDKLSAVQETMLINKLCCFVVWVFFLHKIMKKHWRNSSQ